MNRSLRQNTVSAGGFVVRSREGIIELLLVERIRNVEPKWAPVLCQLPKGMVDAGETQEVAALREVREETGYDATIVGKAGIARWSYERSGVLYEEEVHYFVMHLLSNMPHEPDGEFDRISWMALPEAERAISYPEERQIIRQMSQTLG